MITISRWLMLVAIAIPSIVTAQEQPVLTAMRQEMQRTMKELATTPTPPYFLSYSVAAVSYTHLDVYKRQVFNCSLRVYRDLDVMLFLETGLKSEG